MRQEPNNEIDLLLRQLSRRNGVPVSEFGEQHLDADELNSYVANALPTATRARYTEHLADCSSCRKLVAQLSAAQGPVLVQQGASYVAPSGWKSFLAGLFSPMVLRYAAPALGLIVIATVGFVVFRERSREASIAQLTAADSPASVNRPQAETSAEVSKYSDDSSSDTKKTVGSVDTPAAPARAAQAKGDEANEPTQAAPVIANKTGEATGTFAGPPPAAPKVAAAEEPPPSKEVDKLKKAEATEQRAGAEARAKQREEDAVKNEAQKAETIKVAPGTITRRDIQVQAGRSNAPGPGGAVQEYKRTPDEAKERERAQAKDADSNTETRSIAGRRFRKSGSGWVDTDYDGSKPTTNMARGSEQYQALVADEPSIRTIAEQLAGEVIVVWKGRAYRIR